MLSQSYDWDSHPSQTSCELALITNRIYSWIYEVKCAIIYFGVRKMTDDLEAQYNRLQMEHAKVEKKASTVSGWIFAPIGMVSFSLALLGAFAFGVFAILIAIPGILALGIAILVFWSMTQKSEKRLEHATERLRARN